MPFGHLKSRVFAAAVALLRASGSQSLAAYAVRKDNNFNLLRLLAASIVILGHSYALTGRAGEEPLLHLAGKLDFGTLAVDIFFVISGFLVTKSFLNRRSVWGFVVARVLRIYPGLLVALLSNVLVVGLAFTTVPILAYLTSRDTWAYFAVNGMLLVEGVNLRQLLPGVFVSNPWGAAVNGSLWTLPYEVWIYIGLMGVGLLGILRRRWAVNAVVAVIVALATGLSLHLLTGPFFAAPALPLFLRFATFFGWGTFFYVNRSAIPINGMIAAALLALTALVWRSPITLTLIFPFTLAYIIFWASYVPGGFVRRYNLLGDYSYGVYIYAFPIQQSLIALLRGISPLALAALALPVTLVFAVLSWHLIEKPALNLKKSLQDRAPARSLGQQQA